MYIYRVELPLARDPRPRKHRPRGGSVVTNQVTRKGCLPHGRLPMFHSPHIMGYPVTTFEAHKSIALRQVDFRRKGRSPPCGIPTGGRAPGGSAFSSPHGKPQERSGVQERLT